MKGTLKTRLIELFCTLFIVIVVVWGLFYAVVYHFIYQNAERQLSAATNQITEDLNREFSAMEKLDYPTNRPWCNFWAVRESWNG